MLTAVLCSFSHNVWRKDLKKIFIINCQVYKSEIIPFSRLDDTVRTKWIFQAQKPTLILAEKTKYASKEKVSNRQLKFNTTSNCLHSSEKGESWYLQWSCNGRCEFLDTCETEKASCCSQMFYSAKGKLNVEIRTFRCGILWLRSLHSTWGIMLWSNFGCPLG